MSEPKPMTGERFLELTLKNIDEGVLSRVEANEALGEIELRGKEVDRLREENENLLWCHQRMLDENKRLTEHVRTWSET